MINFYAVGEPKPPSIDDFTYTQDFATLSEPDKQPLLTAAPTEEVYALKDKCDKQDYIVAKLKDSKNWMTKNLNLAGDLEITSELSNVLGGYTLTTSNDFQSGNRLPTSSISFRSDGAIVKLYNGAKASGTDCSKLDYYSYYSWTAATASSGASIATDDTDAPYSICPKGWKLLNSKSTVVGNSDFYQLAVTYGMVPERTIQSTSDFYIQSGLGATPNFLLTGYYFGNGNYSFNNGGSRGYYWSSTSCSSTYTRDLYSNSSNAVSASNSDRRLGSAVRCRVRITGFPLIRYPVSQMEKKEIRQLLI